MFVWIEIKVAAELSDFLYICNKGSIQHLEDLEAQRTVTGFIHSWELVMLTDQMRESSGDIMTASEQ